MDERRDGIRVQPNQKLLMYDRTTGTSLGEVSNVSTEGVMITGSEPYPPSSQFHGRIPLPGHIMLTDELVFDVRSIWTRRVGESDVYQTGFEILHVTPDERENIDLVLRELAVAGYWV